MQYVVLHESNHRIRVHLAQSGISDEEAEILRYALGSIKGVTGVDVYAPTGNLAIRCQDSKDLVLQKLDQLRYENITLFGKELETHIDSEEIQRRKLTPELKRRLRLRILIECAADVFMPMPVQVAYHMYQLVTLKEIF